MKAPFSVEQFHSPGSFLNAVVSAIILAALHITFVLAFAALIFTGELGVFLNQGIGVLLLGALISTAILALLSGYPGSIGSAQDVPATLIVPMTV